MTSRTRRLALIVGVAALVVVAAGSVLAPELRAAPKKDKDTGEFTIKVKLVWGSGDFHASGAISDSGTAEYWGMPGMQLCGAEGTILIHLADGAFTVLQGTGAYDGLAGAGTYTVTTRTKARKGLWGGYDIILIEEYRLVGAIP